MSAYASDEQLVEQIDVVKSEMFKLEDMLDAGDACRHKLYAIRVQFCTEAFALIGRRKPEY